MFTQLSSFTAATQWLYCVLGSGNRYTFISESMFVPGLREEPTTEQQHGLHFNLDIVSLNQSDKKEALGVRFSGYVARNSDVAPRAYGYSFVTVFNL